MTAILDRPDSDIGDADPPPPAPLTIRNQLQQVRRWLSRPRWRRFTVVQLVVLSFASVAPVVIVGALSAALLGAVSVDTMRTVALGAGENPGMILFGAMFIASPVQWFTGRSQVRVRKYLGIVFFLLALSNGAMFATESGVAAIVSAPFLIAGAFAVALSIPLFLTSSRWSQRVLGMKRWRVLHKLTYLVAASLVAHVVLVGDIGPGALLVIGGFIARIPAMRRRLVGFAERRRLEILAAGQ